MLTGIGFALIIGLTGSKDKPLPKYKKILTITLVFLAAFLSLYPPVAGNFEDLKNIVRYSKDAEINVRCDIQKTDDLNLFKGLNSAKPVTISCDGITTSVLTVDGKTITITTTDITRT